MIADVVEHLDWVRLDGRGVAYFEAQLELGSQFCRLIQSTVDLAGGDCSTLLPRETRTDRAYRFDEGGLLLANRNRGVPVNGGLLPAATLRERQTAEIFGFLQSDPNAVCLIDDAAARPNDAPLAAVGFAARLGEDVLYRLGHDSPAHDIGSALAWCNYIWHGLAVLCRPRVALKRGGELSPEAVTRCLEDVVALHAVAYDGEGFVTWTRRGAA
ncbi:MAG TPA: hypothetical protein PK677_17105 [Acidiphilium sp.]|uniref:hypothetical protein n=1 Tax=unclassified Acidiphilium TaxID=2617493 RepID=UPI00257EA759|nr:MULTISPECIES: hypothetical protein [unclassified Acidiphilium]HQT90224.1 hypothetical protein [Acidiphilium sp.]